MSDSQPAIANRAVFLSYASQDAETVLRIAEALRASGVEVWFDKNELVGGDAWDAKIRGQIASCALFVPVISAATQARLEGYANELLARLPAESWVRGFVLSVLGRYDEAVPYLERTPQIYTPALFLDTIWDAYRENPKYVALVAKMGRTEEYKTARQTLARMVKEQAAKK